MRVWKIALAVVLAVGLAGYFGCKGGKYADAKDVMNQSLKTMENFINGLDNAANSQDVVKVINAFAADMTDLKPKLSALEKKYPELKDQANPPEELKDLSKRLEEMSGKLMTSSMKLMQYAQDPEVQKAQEALSKAMMEENE